MVDNQNLIAGLMVKYARRETLTKEENTLLEQWSSRSAEHRLVSNQFKNPEWVRESLKALPPVPSDAIWNALEQRIDDPAPRRIGWRVGAVAVVLVILAGTWLKAYYRPNHVAAKHDQLPIVLADKERKPFSLRLKDGTRVECQSGAIWRYDLSRNGELVVELEQGKAFFQVAKNHERPVTVKVGGRITVLVLGTCFAVDASPATDPRVALISGAARVSGPVNSLLLTPGKEVVLQGEHLIQRDLTDASGLFTWAGEPTVFHFVETDVDMAVREIAQYYHLGVHNPENIKGIRFSVDLSRNRPVDEVLKDVDRLESGAAKVYRDGTRIVITRGTPV